MDKKNTIVGSGLIGLALFLMIWQGKQPQQAAEIVEQTHPISYASGPSSFPVDQSSLGFEPALGLSEPLVKENNHDKFPSLVANPQPSQDLPQGLDQVAAK